ncbi:glycosyltransferase family 4 protein [Curtobacterium pusillum]|uniref:Glycosyltransferase n=1 Tax=Curtobacterium pusillum TaxID=69373 RepID=A0ABX2MA34_9MICO|nr:glycosyltransferase [Curtobacterium pusillum]NUU14323.1 glycosyltransferase [Curtobacterium pusillum]GLK32068.1 glycosyl transferase [Curtobacterium pusillum]
MQLDIVHVSSAHPWVDNRVHLREAAAAAAAGYRVRLIAVESELTAPATGVDVVLIPRRRRVRRMVLSTAQALLLALRSRARVVHLHDPELIWTIPVLRLAGRTVVYDAHEDLPDQVWGKDYLSHRQRAVFAALSHVLLRIAGTANRVVAATAWTGRRFPAARTLAIHNFPLARPEDASQRDLEARPAVVAHVGLLSKDRGIDVISAVGDEAAFPDDWRIEMVGSIDSATSTDRLRTAEANGRVRHRGVVGPMEARDLLLDARIGVVPFRRTPVTDQIFPTKLFEYLAAGLAVIATDVPLWRRLLEGVECVTFVPADDPAAIAAAVRRYADDPELLRVHGAEARRAAERFTWAPEAARLVAMYDELLPGVRHEDGAR